MTGLGEFIGALIADVTRARLQADLEAVRVAEAYRSIPLLEGAPVPRFRLPTISFEVPVVVEQVEGKQGAAPEQSFPPPGTRTLTNLIDGALEQAGIDLRSSTRDELREGIAGIQRRRWHDRGSLAPALRASNEIAADIAQRIAKAGWPDLEEGDTPDEKARLAAVTTFQQTLAGKLQERLLGESNNQPQVMIGPASNEVRELKDPNMVTRIKITLEEDSFEFANIDWDDGVPRERLIPE